MSTSFSIKRQFSRSPSFSFVGKLKSRSNQKRRLLGSFLRRFTLFNIILWLFLISLTNRNSLRLSLREVQNASNIIQGPTNESHFGKTARSPARLINGWSIFRNFDSIKYKERKVPKGISRFDYPWLIPAFVKPLTPAESRNRFLYSPLKDVYINGLGHNLATINGEVSTALNLNLTYTHRISWYSIHSIPFNGMISRNYSRSIELYRPFLHAGSVEQLFGWGVGEIPREHIQNSICLQTVLSGKKGICRVCSNDDFKELKMSIGKKLLQKQVAPRHQFQIDHVVELPYNLTFGFPFKPSNQERNYAVSFMAKHHHPNTVFTLPPTYCATNPVFGSFSRRQKAYFFQKYWSTHGIGSRNLNTRRTENETFSKYKARSTSSVTIKPVGRRPKLTRLNPKKINIAVHARRGDFFVAKRPMISLQSVARITRQIMKMVVLSVGGPFSKLGVSVNIYSEGLPLNHSKKISLHHDVSKLGNQFMDADGSVVPANAMSGYFFKEVHDNYGNVFKNGLEVNARVSENTILSIHEMIAADIFIGSESGLSANVVGSPTRSAFMIIPGTQRIGQSSHDDGMFLRFQYNSSKLSDSILNEMRKRWIAFQRNNKDSI